MFFHRSPTTQEKKLDLTAAPSSLYDNTLKGPTYTPILKIQQSEIAYTADNIRYIATTGAGPCVILILFDKEKKRGLMAHVFSAAEVSPATRGGLWLLAKCLLLYSKSTIDIYMIGGYTGLSELLIKSLDQFINELQSILQINTIYTQLNENWSSSVVFNFNTGKIYSYDCSLDYSLPRGINIIQGLATSLLHWLPCSKLIEYSQEEEKDDSALQEERLLNEPRF